MLTALVCLAQTFTVTAYIATSHPTASGVMPVAGITCAAPRSIPFGTRIHIQGVGWRVVQDRTAKRFDGRIDVFVATKSEAKRFGIKQLEVKTK